MMVRFIRAGASRGVARYGRAPRSNSASSTSSGLAGKTAWVGVDAADETLMSLVAEFPAAAPNLLKPNAHELGQIAGLDGDELESEAANGELARVIHAAHDLRAEGVEEVLVSLGSAGAVLACPEGTWYSPSPDVSVVSTVGAGDSLVAGYLIGKHQLLPPPRRLALAVAYGAAAHIFRYGHFVVIQYNNKIGFSINK